jgi:hypothetical protein
VMVVADESSSPVSYSGAVNEATASYKRRAP